MEIKIPKNYGLCVLHGGDAKTPYRCSVCIQQTHEEADQALGQHFGF